VALVTGGSRGIGRAVVRRLAEDGYDIAFCYRRDPDAAAQAEKDALDAGARVLAVRADVADARAVQRFVAETQDQLGPLEAVVSSAGIVRDTPLVAMKPEAWREVLDANLTGTFNVCQTAVFPLLKRRTGSIVTISSVAGLDGNAGQANYSASKAGIVGFTRTLAKEVARYGVRANCVAPGFIDTDMTGVLDEAQRGRTVEGIPLGRWGTPADVANLVAFLLSDRAAYITAGVFRVDGGLSLLPGTAREDPRHEKAVQHEKGRAA
jgi:3-oxoacyl-[acyl-carrier protein] reductase